MGDYIQVRVNFEEKNKAAQIFSRIGLDISTAVRLFLKHCHYWLTWRGYHERTWLY